MRIYGEIEDLKNRMQDGLCRFVFREVNGECGVTRTEVGFSPDF